MDNEKPKVAVKAWVKKAIAEPRDIEMESEKAETPVSYEEMNRKANLQRGKMAVENAEYMADLSNQFNVNKEDYQIFSRQAGLRKNDITGKPESKTLNINETLSLMVGSTAKTISALTGEGDIPKADMVIYLDKSARPVSWLVDDFWGEMTDEEKPETSYLAIDRRPWFNYVGLELTPNQEIILPDGSKRPAEGRDFWEKFEELPEEKQKDYLARIRCLFIKGGIDDEDPEKILNTPTDLKDKNITVIDEVKRSGATLEIAMGLIARAIPEAKSVNGHVFWTDKFTMSDGGARQMGNTPVWYLSDPDDWRGRGVKDRNKEFWENVFSENPTPENRANKYGWLVLGVPLDFEEEPGQLSKKLRNEIKTMYRDYVDGKILSVLPLNDGKVKERMMEKYEKMGVEFTRPELAKNKSNCYQTLMNKIKQ